MTSKYLSLGIFIFLFIAGARIFAIEGVSYETPISTTYAWVDAVTAVLEVPLKNGIVNSCHGIFVDQTHLLTAAHCFVKDENIAISASEVEKFNLFGKVYSQNHSFEITKVLIHHDFKQFPHEVRMDSESANKPVTTFDIAVVTVSSNFKIAVGGKIYLTSAPANCLPMQSIFIQSHLNKDLRKWDNSYDYHLPQIVYHGLDFQEQNDPYIYAVSSLGNPNRIEKGDSGAPLLVICQSKVFLIGILNGANELEPQNAYFTEVARATNMVGPQSISN